MFSILLKQFSNLFQKNYWLSSKQILKCWPSIDIMPSSIYKFNIQQIQKYI